MREWAACHKVRALHQVVYGMVGPSTTAFFCSLAVPQPAPTTLSFAAACDAMRPSARILFAGELETACRYHARGNTLYRIDLAQQAVLVDGFATYDRLCELEPRLAEIVFKDADGSWRRRSEETTDYEIFTRLGLRMRPRGEHGITFLRGFKHFPDETILFEEAAVEKIVQRDDGECEEILRRRLEAPARRPHTVPTPKRRRIDLTPKT